MMPLTTPERIQKSWDIRRSLIEGILEKGDILVASLKLVPETRESLKFDHWKSIASQELEEARKIYGNGEPVLSERELHDLATITFPVRGW